MWPVSLFFLKNLLLCIIGTLSSLPGKFKYSFMNDFLSWWNYSQLRFNWTKEYYIYIYIYIYIFVKLTIVVEGDPKADFLLATTPRCRREPYSFPWIAPL